MKFNKLFSVTLLSLGAMFFLNSCGDESTNPAPTIDMIAENGSVTGDITLGGDEPFTLVFNVSDDSKVKSIEVTSTVDGRTTAQFDTTVNTETIKIKLTRKTLARIASEVWTISATDNDGKTGTKSFTITTNSAAGGNPLTSYDKDPLGKALRVWNFHGPNTGAFDLLDGSAKTKNDNNADKDVHDSTGTAEITQWPGRWTSKNGTMFKKITSYTYDDIQKTGQLDAAWDASGTAVKFMLLAKDDLYVAKLRGTDTKVLVKIIDVVKTSGDNLDYVEFIFKKE
ncbi:MAG: hypothetical protein H6605_05095 [Flavobacteriales bacterium]|nr:hypothetical protein [Flavobacteriales bacterium]